MNDAQPLKRKLYIASKKFFFCNNFNIFLCDKNVTNRKGRWIGRCSINNSYVCKSYFLCMIRYSINSSNVFLSYCLRMIRCSISRAKHPFVCYIFKFFVTQKNTENEKKKYRKMMHSPYKGKFYFAKIILFCVAVSIFFYETKNATQKRPFRTGN